MMKCKKNTPRRDNLNIQTPAPPGSNSRPASGALSPSYKDERKYTSKPSHLQLSGSLIMIFKLKAQLFSSPRGYDGLGTLLSWSEPYSDLQTRSISRIQTRRRGLQVHSRVTDICLLGRFEMGSRRRLPSAVWYC